MSSVSATILKSKRSLLQSEGACTRISQICLNQSIAISSHVQLTIRHSELTQGECKA